MHLYHLLFILTSFSLVAAQNIHTESHMPHSESAAPLRRTADQTFHDLQRPITTGCRISEI